MTYPPQQPGPYGPQDPYGQQQPYGQQPYGQQPYGQQPQYGTPPWGQQPGYPVGPPPKKSRAGLITALVVVAVLVIGGGVAAFLLLKDDGGGAGGGGETPRAAADAFTKTLGTTLSTKLEDVDLTPLRSLTCGEDYKELNDELAEARRQPSSSTEASEQPEKTTFGVANFKEEGDGATFDMTQQRGEHKSDPMKMDVKKENGNWVVCGLYRETEDGGEPVPPGSGGDGGESSESGETGGGSIPNPIPKSSN